MICVSIPFSASRIAVNRPAGPAPTTRTSLLRSFIVRLLPPLGCVLLANVVGEKLMLAFADDQHGAFCVTDYLFGNAPEPNMLDAGIAVRRDDDQVSADLFRDAGSLQCRLSVPDENIHGD